MGRGMTGKRLCFDVFPERNTVHETVWFVDGRQGNGVIPQIHASRGILNQYKLHHRDSLFPSLPLPQFPPFLLSLLACLLRLELGVPNMHHATHALDRAECGCRGQAGQDRHGHGHGTQLGHIKIVRLLQMLKIVLVVCLLSRKLDGGICFGTGIPLTGVWGLLQAPQTLEIQQVVQIEFKWPDHEEHSHVRGPLHEKPPQVLTEGQLQIRSDQSLLPCIYTEWMTPVVLDINTLGAVRFK